MSTPTASPLAEWHVPTPLRRGDVEGWLAKFRQSQSPQVLFRIGDDRIDSDSEASASLQGAICWMQREGIRTFVTYPEDTFVRDDEASLFDLSSPTDPGSANTETADFDVPLEADDAPSLDGPLGTLALLPGLILGQLCDSYETTNGASTLRSLQAGAVSERDGFFGLGDDRALAMLADSTRAGRDAFTSQPLDELRTLQAVVLSLTGTRSFNRENGRDPQLERLVDFVYQAVENAHEHAAFSLASEKINQVRFLTARRHLMTLDADGNVQLGNESVDSASPVGAYLHRIQAKAARRGASPNAVWMHAITVADGGVGIAARLADSLDVYSGDLQREAKLTLEALLPGITTKVTGSTGRGLGTRKMLRATRQLDGLFQLRTGRLDLHRHYLTDDGEQQDASFTSRDSDSFQLVGADEERVLVAGTTVSLLIPNWHAEVPPTHVERSHQPVQPSVIE